MHRFFVPRSCFQGDSVTLGGAVVHQIRDVLRLQPGDSIIVLDDSGWEYQVRLATVRYDEVSGQVQQKVLARTEPRAKLTLYQSLLKGDRFEYVLQKGTELGIVEFVPVVADRCAIGSVDEVGKAKLARWERIVSEAAEQSRRGRLPRLHPPLLFAQACERARRSDLAILPWEEERMRSMRAMLRDSDSPPPMVQGKPSLVRRPFSVSIFIGPEGGFTAREADHARRYGIVPVSLGPRILRADTAALVAATVVLYELEDLQLGSPL